jgi:hypothetical protein
MDEMKDHFNFVPSFISLFPQGSLKIQFVCHIFSVKLLVQPDVSYVKGKQCNCVILMSEVKLF